MDTIEKIHDALEWANKRLEKKGEPITENQRNYIVFALRQQLTIPVVSQQSELLVDFWMNLPNTNKNKAVAKHYVDIYLKSTNCD